MFSFLASLIVRQLVRLQIEFVSVVSKTVISTIDLHVRHVRYTVVRLGQSLGMGVSL